MNNHSIISIAPPLSGRWQFLRPPGHHPHAFDFVKLNDAGSSSHRDYKIKFLFGRIMSDNYFCWNEPVYAPVSGTIIRCANDWPDHPFTNLWNTLRIWYNATFQFKPKEVNGRLDIRPNAGNHIMIQTDRGFIVFLAHLRSQSLQVEEGDRVTAGQMIGHVGNSGNSTAPHLHINLFDQMEDPYTARVLPFVFTRFKTCKNNTWSEHSHSVPDVKASVAFEID